jgi:hypothetical protein
MLNIGRLKILLQCDATVPRGSPASDGIWIIGGFAGMPGLRRGDGLSDNRAAAP